MAITGMVDIYDNNVPDKRMVTDRIFNQDPYDIATWLYLGSDVSKFNFRNLDEYTYDWLNDAYLDRTSTLGAAITDSTTTTLSITTADYTLFQDGDVILIDSEQFWISAMSTTTATVTGGFGGSSRTTHLNGAVITRISRARRDGEDADDSPSTEITSTTNVTQILQRTVHLSRSRLKAAQYGISNLEDYTIDLRMKELMMDLARLPYYGLRSAGTENSVARYAGGFKTFITNNLTYATSSGLTGGTAQALTEDHFGDTLQNIFEDGGNPDLIFCGAHAQRKISKLFEGYVQTTRTEGVGGILINKMLNPVSGGMLDIVVDRNCPTNNLWILTKDKIAFYPFDSFFYERLAKDGDSVKGEIVGEYGFVVVNDKWHGGILEFSTTD